MRKLLAVFILVSFLMNTLVPVPLARAQQAAVLPAPGLTPVIIRVESLKNLSEFLGT